MRLYQRRVFFSLAFSLPLFTPLPGAAGFLSDGFHYGKVSIGETQKDKYIRACHDTKYVQYVTVSASLDTWGGDQKVRGPFELETQRYNLVGSFHGLFPPKWHGECHNFHVYFTPTSVGQACTMVYFYYSSGSDERKEERMVCGTGAGLEWLPAVLDLIAE